MIHTLGKDLNSAQEEKIVTLIQLQFVAELVRYFKIIAMDRYNIYVQV